MHTVEVTRTVTRTIIVKNSAGSDVPVDVTHLELVADEWDKPESEDADG